MGTFTVIDMTKSGRFMEDVSMRPKQSRLLYSEIPKYILISAFLALIACFAEPIPCNAQEKLAGLYTIQQKANKRYVDAYELIVLGVRQKDHQLVTRPWQGNDSQRWILTNVGDNIYTIQQKANKRYVDAHESSAQDYRLVTRPWQGNDSQRWIIIPSARHSEEPFDDKTKKETLWQYAPQVNLHSKERFWPSSVEWSFRFLYRHYSKQGLWWLFTKEELREPSSVLNYFHGSNPKMQIDGLHMPIDEVPAYGFWHRVNVDTVDLLYYFYYPYNRGKSAFNTIVGSHVGDWEHVTVRLTQKQDAQGRSRLEPVKIWLDAHGKDAGKTVLWTKIPREQSGHPIIFSAQGSHASYASSGTHRYKTVMTDETDKGYPWRTWRKLEKFNHDTQKGLGPTWDGTWPNWLLKARKGDKTGDEKPDSGPVFRWGNYHMQQKVFGYYRLDDGPIGPANKPYLTTPGLD